MTAFRHALTLALLVGLTLPAIAAEPPLPRALLDCVRETDSLRRLVCYDREVARATSAPPAAATVVAPVAPAAPQAQVAPAAAPGAAAASFGEEQVAARRKEREAAAEKSITAGIVSLKPYRVGANLITLDNEQVWRMEESESHFPLKDGDTVRIERGLLGSYHLTLVQEGWKRRTRVSRVR
jgi:hypothetical protein